jgi:hypothetical protein
MGFEEIEMQNGIRRRRQLYRMYRQSQLKLKNEGAVSSLEMSWIL